VVVTWRLPLVSSHALPLVPPLFFPCYVQQGSWDDVSGDNFLRKLLSMPVAQTRWDFSGKPFPPPLCLRRTFVSGCLYPAPCCQVGASKLPLSSPGANAPPPALAPGSGQAGGQHCHAAH
jgi:hypothetical protein